LEAEGLFPWFQEPSALSQSWARQIQSIPPHLISLRSILILSTNLRLGLPSTLFPSEFPTSVLYAFLFFSIHATRPAHPILLDLIALIILDDQYKVRNSSLDTLTKYARWSWNVWVDFWDKHRTCENKFTWTWVR
jgi:hypothetical protein